jgi:hypothetical protein
LGVKATLYTLLDTEQEGTGFKIRGRDTGTSYLVPVKRKSEKYLKNLSSVKTAG